jgi:hypothetical protein
MAALFSCHEEEGDESIKIYVNTEKGKKFPISDLFSEVQYTKLETNDKNTIALIDKMLIEDDRIFILDSKSMKIVIFKRDGNFVNQNNNLGRGPGEFQYISDFLIDSNSGNIELLDIGNRKIIKLDTNGGFINEKPFLLYTRNFCKLSGNEYIFLADNYVNPIIYPEQSCNIMILDSADNLIKSFLPINELSYLTGPVENRLVKFKNGVNFSYSYCYHIYHCDTGFCKVIYSVDFGKNSIPEQLITEYGKIDKSDLFKRSEGFSKIIQTVNENSYVNKIRNIFENEKILTFQYSLYIPGEKDGTYTVIYDKRTKKTYSGKPENDIDLGLFGSPLALIGDTLFTYVYPDKMIEKMKIGLSPIEKKNENYSSLTHFISGINEFDNPIIIKFILKR